MSFLSARNYWKNHYKKPLLLYYLVYCVVVNDVQGQPVIFIPLGRENFTSIRDNLSESYQLVENIYLNGSQWAPVSGEFTGIFNGNFHSIFGLNVTTNADNTPTGLFGTVTRGYIYNLILSLPSVLSTGKTSPAGALAGRVTGSTIKNIINVQGLVRTEGANAPAGGLIGSVGSNTYVENILNTGDVSTNGSHAYAGGAVGYLNSNVSQAINIGVNQAINTGTISSLGTGADTGGLVGYASGGWVSQTINTGNVTTNGWSANAGGAVGGAHSSPVSQTLNIGNIVTKSTFSSAGGAAGFAGSGSTVKQTLNTGRVYTTAITSNAGGAVGYANYNSDVSQVLNIGSLSTQTKLYGSDAGGVVGFSRSNIAYSINIGTVTTQSSSSDAGGALGGNSGNAISVKQIINIGSVSTQASGSDAGGAVGRADSATVVSKTLNTGTVTEVGGTPNNPSYGLIVVSDTQLRNGLNGLDSGYWNSGNTTQYPMIKHISALYQDLRRLDGTHYHYGNNTFPVILNEFAKPADNSSESIFNQVVWRLKEGCLPLLRGFSREQAELARIDCKPGGFACPDMTHLIPSITTGNALPSPSSLDPVLITQIEPTSTIYEKESTISTFTNNAIPTTTKALTTNMLSESVSSRAFENIQSLSESPLPEISVSPTPSACDSIHCPAQYDGTLEYLMNDGQHLHGIVRENAPEQNSYWFIEQDGQKLSFPCCGVYDFSNLASSGGKADAALFHKDYFFVAYRPLNQSGQIEATYSTLAILRLSGNQIKVNSSQSLNYQVVSLFDDGNSVFINSGENIYPQSSPQDAELVNALETEEAIQSADYHNSVFYLLTHKTGIGYRIRILPESKHATSVIVETPSGITASTPVTASIKVSGNRLHLLMIESNSVIWREYSLEALQGSADSAMASDALADMPQSINPAAITLMPSGNPALAKVFILGASRGMPQYARMLKTDFIIQNGSQPEAEDGEWPLWGKVVLGVGSGITALAGFGGLLVMVKHTYNHYMYPDKEDTVDQLMNKLRPGKRRKSCRQLPLPGIPSPQARNPFPLDFQEGSVMNVEPVLTQIDARPYEQPIALYDQVGAHPYEVPRSSTQASQRNKRATNAETTMVGGHYEAIDPNTGAIVETYPLAPVPQPNPYEEPVNHGYHHLSDVHTHQPDPDPMTLEQLPEQEPDNLDGYELSVMSEEPWYANTNPGAIASAPVYTELNKPSAKRVLQCMEAQQSGTTPLACVEAEHPPIYFHRLVHLQGANPFTRLGKARLKVMAKGFDLVFRGMEAVDSYVYDFPPGHPKRTRVHSQHVAEVLYGEHLTTPELFDSRIGDMEDPVIGFCNAMGTNIWHAFLIFRNSRTGEYNTLHIRQGSYYPEFMDRVATERYFHFEQKRIVGAISLTRLTQAYGANLDLNLLREIFKRRLANKSMCYRIQNQNCMTFSMLAFWATNFDWARFLEKMGLARLQSPFHILKALEGCPVNHPALHAQENNLLPDWLAELNKDEDVYFTQ